MTRSTRAPRVMGVLAIKASIGFARCRGMIAPLAALLIFLAAPPLLADAPPDDPAALIQPDRVDIAIEQAVDYIVSHQHEDGYISDRGANNANAMTSLAIMAMGAVGHQPADPTPQGRAMRRALEWMLHDERIDDRGYLGRSDSSRMYGHGIAALMLTEMIGHGVSDEQDARVLRRCQQAIDLILQAQQVEKHPGQEGGWRYTPDARDSDLSVTVWQLMALRSAYNAGLDVPASAIDDAVEYLRRSYRSRERDSEGRPLDLNSGFGYQPGRNPSNSVTAMGMLAMILCGEYDALEVEGAGNFLMNNPPEYRDQWFFYSAYYYAQSMYQHSPEHHRVARAHIEDLLLEHQRDDGSWQAAGGTERNAGNVYATAMATLSLAVKHHYLPIYQR